MMNPTPANLFSLAAAPAAGWVAFSASVVVTDRNRTGDVLAGGIAR